MTPEIVLRERFGLTDFRPGQRPVIEALLEGGAALAVFPTGGGKSLCYQLPALLLEGLTVVISPLIALMKDQIDFLRERGIAAARLDSSLSLEETRAVEAGMRDGSLRLLYVAPERFNNERFLEKLSRVRIALFAIDEAHCISEWGHNFRPDYLKLADTARELGVERVLALTATATPPVVADVCASFNIPAGAAVVTGFHRPNLFLQMSPTRLAERDTVLVERMHTLPPGPGIVYVTLQATAERVAGALVEAGLPARAYHAGMKAEERTRVQEWWKESNRATVVATIAFGMGIDKADVRYVYHYNLPKGLESYSQEIGRAGRDGLPSRVELLGAGEDVATLENFAYGDTPTPGSLRGLLRAVLGGEAEFGINLHTLGAEHDLRPLVLRTALTYLELLGVVRQGTPFYAGFKIRPLGPVEEIVGHFTGERAAFVASLFARAKRGREWYTLDAQAQADELGEDRSRVISALNYLGEKGWVELQVFDARQHFSRVVADPDVERIAAELSARFARREEQEVERIGRVVGLATRDGCLTNHLLEYFGEVRDAPCGHCGWCETGQAAAFPPALFRPPVDARVDADALGELQREHPEALGHPRQVARFLCGLSSPALTRAKLSRHPLAGELQGERFAEVLAWCEARG